jgi:twinkle protein
VIDPWNEVEHLFNGLSETQYISQELTKIRRFARLNGIHIWIVAHPTKLQKNSQGKYDPPTMYDISGGAHWRNKADNGICVYRDFETNQTEIIVQKIRFKEIGKLGSAKLKYTYSGNYKAWG